MPDSPLGELEHQHCQRAASTALTSKEQELQQIQINGNELVCRSWLLKRSRTTLLWKKLWFVLRRNSQLAIYKDEDEYKPLNIINLKEDDITVSKIVKQKTSNKDKDKFQFALFSPKNKTIHLRALNEYDYNNWYLNLEKMLLAAPAERFERAASTGSVTKSQHQQHLQKDHDDGVSVHNGDQRPPVSPLDLRQQADDLNPYSISHSSTNNLKHSNVSQQNLHTNSSNYTHSDIDDNATGLGLNDEDYFTSDNEGPPGTATFNPDTNFPIQEENEEEILREEQELFEEQSSQNKLNLEKIKNSESPDFMKDYLIQHYSYNSTKPEHIIQKGYLVRIKNLNQWRKFFIIMTNKHLIFYKIHNYSETKNIDYENLIEELANKPEILTNNPIANDDSEEITLSQSKKIAVYPSKIIDLKNLVDVVQLDPLSKSKQNCLLIITPTKRYRFCTKTETELINWLIIFKSFLIVRKKEIEFKNSEIESNEKLS